MFLVGQTHAWCAKPVFKWYDIAPSNRGRELVTRYGTYAYGTGTCTVLHQRVVQSSTVPVVTVFHC